MFGPSPKAKSPNAGSSSSLTKGSIDLTGETIVALATPPGRGAVAVIRASGPAVRAIAGRLVRGRNVLRPRVAARADVLDEHGRRIDSGLALFFPRPASYTGEDVLELQVHGSPVVAREVVRAWLACGARNATEGEFTRRAFLNGKIGLHEAEAVADLIAAETRSAARAAAANLNAGLSEELVRVREGLHDALDVLAAAIDFPDEVADPDPHMLAVAIDAAAARLRQLRTEGERGRLIREGVSVAIVGPPNAGKSSLLNALLGEERAIVSEVAGTTRDTIEESITIGNVLVRLVDTAGIRSHTGHIEAQGIERTHRALAGARIALIVIDGSKPLDAAARDILTRTDGRTRVIFFNKADLGETGAREFDEAPAVRGSTRDAQTRARIERALAMAGWGGEDPDLERPHLSALREFDAVEEALDALTIAAATLRHNEPVDLIAGELHRAIAALGHISESAVGEELLDRIFARFCIGK
jgi:tRNA modification GTPase